MYILLKKIINYAIYIIHTLIVKPFIGNSRERIWLVACGGERWGDSADAFWRYMNREHPEIRTVAIVKGDAHIADNKKNWIKRNTLYSYYLIIKAEILATTHTLSDIGPERIVILSKAKTVWLQHGVIAIGKITAEKARLSQYNLICASSVQEKNVMVEELGIRSDLISVTGLARHDALLEKLKKDRSRAGLLFIPTSRKWSNRDHKKAYEKLFFTWISLARENGIMISIKMWLHPGWEKSGLDDLGLGCEEIEFYNYKKDPQDLICSSKVLVTDFSSIFFDAALSGIPTIFYQPDRREYIKQKGILNDFINQDTLLVVENEKDLLVKLDKIISNNDYYKERIRKDQQWAYKYVETFDGYSCRRLYQQVMALLKTKGHDNDLW